MGIENIRKKHKEEEINQFKEDLKKWFELGDFKVYCVLRGVSRSGMTRYIDFYTFVPNTQEEINKGYGKITKIYLTYKMGVILGYGIKTEGLLIDSGLKVEGCGMDMGFSVVNHLGIKLYNNDGYKLKHEWI
jgi:hypothetical protein